jgi:diguanylate cyclase (GGDEF)-like protein
MEIENERLTVLVVDDQKMNRLILRNLLEEEYDVVEASDGREALDILTSGADVGAVLLDIIMPVMDGYEFLRAVSELAFSQLPVIAVTGEDDAAAEQKALDLGAWDFVSKPYQANILLLRLRNAVMRSQFNLVNEMKYAYEHDALTDLYNRAKFFERARHLLNENPGRKFALVRFDIDNFHGYNAFFGEEGGNRLLRAVADFMRREASKYQPCVFARLNADVFCVCEPYDPAAIDNHVATACRELAEYERSYIIEPSFGVYIIDDPGEKIETMLEKAALAALECKGRYLEYMRVYTPDMSDRLIREQSIINQMQTALDERQFVAYFQPKYNLETERPYGAEALVRWKHPERGLIPPGEFIPVFERNGFIGKVDRYVWESVCASLRGWIDQGLDPAPVSVNMSRVNMFNPNLVGILTGLTEKYGISPALLELELTESAYMENPAAMKKLVDELHGAGFKILMDDFGSGYSSLNTLKNISVDVLKIDMKFLSIEDTGSRDECILASIIRMASWLEIPVIMEGVETKRQVDFLRSVGCQYVQGYYFAKPMPEENYEELLRDGGQKPASSLSRNHAATVAALWPDNPIMDLLFNSIRHPAAVYSLENGDFRALRVNESFSEFFGYGACFDYSAGENIAPETRSVLMAAFDKAMATGENAVCRCVVRGADGKPKNAAASVQYWGSNENSHILFTAFSIIKE